LAPSSAVEVDHHAGIDQLDLYYVGRRPAASLLHPDVAIAVSDFDQPAPDLTRLDAVVRHLERPPDQIAGGYRHEAFFSK
jgi:hypothetical protein